MYLFRDGTRVLSKRRVDVLTRAGRFKLVGVITKLGFEPFLIAPILAGWRTSTGMVFLRYWKMSLRATTVDAITQVPSCAPRTGAVNARRPPERAERSDEH